MSLPLTTVTFNPCDTRQCVNITINDDMDVEYYHEWFLVHVRLIRTTDIGSRVELLSDIIFVDIIDTDGMTNNITACQGSDILGFCLQWPLLLWSQLSSMLARTWVVLMCVLLWIAI